MTTVEPGSFAFMGRFSTNQSLTLGDVDELQRHFMHIIEGEMAGKSGFNKLAGGITSRRLDPHKTEGRDRSRLRIKPAGRSNRQWPLRPIETKDAI